MRKLAIIAIVAIFILQLYIIYLLTVTNMRLENVSYNTNDIARQLEIDLNY